MSFKQHVTDWTVKTSNVSKCYRVYQKPRHRLLERLLPGKRQLHREFWALHDVNIELKRGSTLGVIGRNGSGKSTLLQIICGTLQPSSGSVEVDGRIGALLELGSGFNPEFSGLENIYLNASILGLKKKEIEEQLDAIVEFADIGDFLLQPVKQYSSGMVVRLAFAVQAHIKPSILVVDEALAVGDELFQKKCFAHLERLKQAGTSILLVSHSCSQINQQCDSVVLLHKGQQKLIGDPHRVTAIYQQLINADDSTWERVIAEEHRKEQRRFSEALNGSRLNPSHSDKDQTDNAQALTDKIYKGDGHENKGASSWHDPTLVSTSQIDYPHHGARILDIEIFNQQGKPANHFSFGVPFEVVVRCEALEDLDGVKHGCFIANHTGTRVSGQAFPQGSTRYGPLEAGLRWEVHFSFLGGLWPGLYFIGAGLTDGMGSGLFLHRRIDHAPIRILEDGLSTPIGNTSLSADRPTVKLLVSD